MTNIPARCYKCNGEMKIKEGVRICSSCGWRFERWLDARKFYDHNKEAIIESLREIGRPKTEEAWGIAHSTMSQLLKRWQKEDPTLKLPKAKQGRQKQEKPVKKAPAPAPRPARTPDKAALPELPAFSDSWPMLVQIEWLKTYRDLKLGRPGE